MSPRRRRGRVAWPGTVTLALALAMVPASGTLAQETAAEPLPDILGTQLEPGRYASSAVGPTIDFRVGDGWLVGPSGGGPIFTLERTDPPGTVVSVTRFDGETFLDSCDPTSMAVVEPSVERLAEIIAGNPFLNAAPPAAIEVDGFSGVQLDVGVPAYTECPRAFVLIWAVPIGEGGEFVQVANQQSRFVILDVDGDVIVIAVESFPGVPFGSLLDASMDLIESMRIEPGEYMAPTPTPEPTPTSDPVSPTQTETGARAMEADPALP